MNEQIYKWMSATLLCTTIIAGATSLYLNSQVINLRDEYQRTIEELDQFTIELDIKIDYGNGTTKWYNDTRVGVGESLLNATTQVANVQVSYSSFGAFVNNINEVGGDPDSWWLWKYYENEWMQGPVGANQWIVHDGDIVAWIYTSF